MQRAFSLPRVYALTDVRLSGRSHPEQVALLSQGGATFVQLREKQLAPLEFYQQAKRQLRLLSSAECGSSSTIELI